jgi:hypothetical protein
MVESYPEMADSFWKEENRTTTKKIPEGQLVLL